MAGFSESASIWLAAVTAAAQSVGVCFGIYFIESCGRRTLVLSSLAMVVASLVCLGTGFYLYDKDEKSLSAVDTGDSSSNAYALLVVGAMMTYLFTFGVGMSSVPWTINAEIYPNHARSLGTSASTTVNWLGNVVVSATFLTLASSDALGKDGAFWLYASIGVVGWIWLYRCMPETKGLSLEEIELLFEREGDPARPGDRGEDGVEDEEGSTFQPGLAMKCVPGGSGGFALLEEDRGVDGDGDGWGNTTELRRDGEGSGSWVRSRGKGGWESSTMM